MKYFLLFVLNLPSASFIKCPLAPCIWGGNEEEFPVLSIPFRIWFMCHYIWCHIPPQTLFSQADVFLSPYLLLIQKLLHIFAFILIIYSTVSNPTVHFLRWKGPNMPQFSRCIYIMNMCSKGHAHSVGWGVPIGEVGWWWLGNKTRRVHSQEHLLTLGDCVWYHQQSANHCGCCSFTSV